MPTDALLRLPLRASLHAPILPHIANTRPNTEPPRLRGPRLELVRRVPHHADISSNERARLVAVVHGAAVTDFRQGQPVWAVYAAAAAGPAGGLWDEELCGGLDELVAVAAEGSV